MKTREEIEAKVAELEAIKIEPWSDDDVHGYTASQISCLKWVLGQNNYLDNDPNEIQDEDIP